MNPKSGIITISSAVFLLLFANSCFIVLAESHCRAWLLQSIPTDMPLLRRVPGVLSTGDVLRWLAGNSTNKLDVIAQYWQLIAHPEDPLSGDYGYSEQDMTRFGAFEGSTVYQAIEDAADRNVSIRLNVKNVTLLLGDWWRSVIVHAKVRISDWRDVYIASADDDWKALTQLTPVRYGISNGKLIEQFHAGLMILIAEQGAVVGLLFLVLWRFSMQQTIQYYQTHICLKFQSKLLDTDSCSSLPSQLSYISFAPPELLFGKYLADEQAWIDTIKSVGSGAAVRINTMDWLVQSQFTKEKVYWSSLSSAISEVVLQAC